jgi:putative ABC transport system ATP-binding protein
MSLLRVRQLGRPPLFAARDLEVARGEIVVLRGPSGSGKTLFLRALADLDPAEGALELEGRSREAFAPAEWRAAVLYVHQAGVRLPGTVRDNLERIAAIARRRGANPEVPAREDLPLERDAQQLSGGEAQTLALVRALMLEPRVLLLDESTSSMDADRAEAWERRIREWVDGGRAAVWVAHDAELAKRVGGRLESFS